MATAPQLAELASIEGTAAHFFGALSKAGIIYTVLMASVSMYDPEHWRDRAREMRALAVQVSDSVSRDTMLDIAKNYDKLALRAEIRLHDDGK